MKTKNVIILIVAILTFCLYGYYSFLSYKIYKDIAVYERYGNEAAVKFSKKVIIEKYPYSIPYFIVK